MFTLTGGRLLQMQVGSDDVSEVSILPTVRVNGRQYRGALSVKEVTRALCSGFPKDREPPVCNNNAVTGAPDECLPGEAGYLVSTSVGSHRLHP